MLSSRGPGKYLAKTWHRDRDNLMRGRGTSQEYTQAELELSDIEVNGVNFPESYELETTPLDPATEPHTRDLRTPIIRGGPGV